jgi:hypothetical protein
VNRDILYERHQSGGSFRDPLSKARKAAEMTGLLEEDFDCFGAYLMGHSYDRSIVI